MTTTMTNSKNNEDNYDKYAFILFRFTQSVTSFFIDDYIIKSREHFHNPTTSLTVVPNVTFRCRYVLLYIKKYK